MMSLLIISIIMAILYVGVAIWKLHALPDSISAMVYVLDKRWQWLWSVWLWLVAITLPPSLIDAMGENWQFIGFLTIACLMFVGAMPLIPGTHNKTHNVLGVIAGILSQVCVAIIYPWWLMAWFVWIMAALYTAYNVNDIFEGKAIFMAEFVCWLSLTGSLLF